MFKICFIKNSLLSSNVYSNNNNIAILKSKIIFFFPKPNFCECTIIVLMFESKTHNIKLVTATNL